MFWNQTVEQDGSFVKVASKDASKMAKSTLEWIKNDRAAEKLRHLEKEQKEINNGFWHKLFKCKDATLEDARESLGNNPWDFYHLTDIRYYKTEEACRRILKACEHAEEIYISTKDLQRIS